MKRLIVFFACVLLPTFASAEVSGVDKKEIRLTAVEVVKVAGALVERGDFSQAETILTAVPRFNNLPLEIERQYLLGQIASRRGDYDAAIRIYQKLLDDQPTLAKVRFELALCYIKLQQWYRADYHLRLAMASPDLTDDVKAMMRYFRYLVRRNKNWNIWFNVGAAPDNNINNGVGGQECVNTAFGTLCRDLNEPESAVGYNLSLGGDYEFKLTDEHWRWKNAASVYTNVYDLHDYDDLYMTLQSGPRYVYSDGSVWLSAVLARRYYGWQPYMYSYGANLAADYDFTRRFSGGATLGIQENKYDVYGDSMNGQTYRGGLSLSYSFDASKYLLLRGNIAREQTLVDTYSSWNYTISPGFGAETYFGFSLYLDASFTWINYDGGRWTVTDGRFNKITENDFVQRYSISVSNNKLTFWGFVPTITYSYTRRDSNIWQREFDKSTVEFTLRQRF